MLVKFKSKNAGDVLMYEEHAKPVLDLLQKNVKRGVIPAAEIPAALARLQTEIAEQRAHPTSEAVQRDVIAHHGDFGDDNGHERTQPVSFATRIFPLMELLRTAQHEGNDVAWGI